MFEKIKKLSKFAFIGGLATLLDWTIFYLLAIRAEVFYLVALIISFSTSAFFNFYLNKRFTFKNKSKKVIAQLSVFLVIASASLFLSILIMIIFVEYWQINKIVSRIITTSLVFFINYFVHKSLTFNPRIFK